MLIPSNERNRVFQTKVPEGSKSMFLAVSRVPKAFTLLFRFVGFERKYRVFNWWKGREREFYEFHDKLLIVPTTIPHYFSFWYSLINYCERENVHLYIFFKSDPSSVNCHCACIFNTHKLGQVNRQTTRQVRMNLLGSCLHSEKYFLEFFRVQRLLGLA